MAALGGLGLGDYGSDSEDEEVQEAPVAGPSNPNPKPSTIALLSSLPPPKNSKKSDGPKKIVIPKMKPASEDVEGDEDERPAKRQRTEEAAPAPGGGKSSLLGMLPAPKKSTFALPPPKRTTVSKPPVVKAAQKAKDDTSTEPARDVSRKQKTTEEDQDQGLEHHALGLGDVLLPNKTPPDQRLIEPTDPVKPHASFLPTITAAPDLDNWEDFVPPEPTPTDPYPGFYKHPSGEWKQHDQDYYMQFYNKWTGQDSAALNGVEPSPKDKAFDGFRAAQGVEANARKAWQEADVERQKWMAQKEAKRQEEEERQKAEEEGRAQPKYKAPDSKTSRVARARHQLGGEIMRAMAMQQQIEENLSAGKQARKEARRKYGF